MPDQIYIGKFGNGLKLNVKPFNIDNDSFYTLFNAYVWRGQVKRKRGTQTLARLQRQIELVLTPTSSSPWQIAALVLVAGSKNLISSLSLGTGSSIAPGTIDFFVGADEYTEPTIPNGTLLKNGVADPNSSINYATGAIFIQGGGGGSLIGTFGYFPDLAVLGLEDFVSNSQTEDFPLQIAFDNKFAYEINQAGTPFYYNVSYYKNTNVPFQWSNDDSAQFYTTNYQHAFWATNNKPGFNFKALTNNLAGSTSIIRVTATQVTVGLNSHGLIVGDYLWFNEVVGTIGTGSGLTLNQNINGQTGKVFAVVDSNTLTVNFDGSTGTNTANFQAGATGTSGIAQFLTNTIVGQDGIKWYDGDPTNSNGIPTGSTGLGWVNFAPLLTGSGGVSIDDEVQDVYYLVGALHIIPFKDRLLFSSPWIQSSEGPPIQLLDTILWSWNGTPYYSALVPTFTPGAETFDTRAYYVDQTGLGGYLPAGISQPIKTIISNEDVLLVGFGGTGKKTRFVYTGNDLQPFLFYLINSELPSNSTFSAITLDRGMVDIGDYGIAITSQQMCQRIDLDIPDEVFKIQALNNGQNRVNAIRDFINEWIYFSYPTGNGQATSGSYVYPSQSFFFNYREKTWAIFKENFTHHGTYRKQSYYTWATLPQEFNTWGQWNVPWNAGTTSALYADVVAGNPQGFVVIKDQTTGEAPTGAISAISNDGLNNTKITSRNHCVNSGDYLYFLSSIGSTYLNGKIGRVIKIIDASNYVVDIKFEVGTYLGLGTYTRLSQLLVQTKQFPFYWEQGKKVRLGVQKYLLEKTAKSQISLNIYLSQDAQTVWNSTPILPANDVQNSSLIYSQVLYTCPESTNLGLTPANTNLQMPTASSQSQIWHRINTSLIGDTVQVGFTLNDLQMRNLEYATAEIILHGMILNVSPSQQLS